MNKKQRRWTKEEERFLIENYISMSNEDMAKELGRTACSVRNKVTRSGLRTYESESMRLKQIKSLSHLSAAEIAKELGITQSRVSQMCREYNLSIKSGAKSNYEIHKQFLSDNIGVMTVSDMARELNTSRQNVQNYLYDNRLEVVNDDFALYHNDDLIGVGNLYELSDMSGILPSQLLWHYHNRNGKRKFAYEMIKLEGEK